MGIRTRYYICLLLVAVVVCILATRKNLPGTYVANYKIGADTVRVFSNHKYTRICHPNAAADPTRYIDTGTWEELNGSIWFRNWYSRHPSELDQSNTPCISGAYIDRSWFIGKMRLLLNDDLGYYYIKQ
jgi:hypothetical protein